MTKQNSLPPEMQAFAMLLDAQPGHVQRSFQYCLCLAMCETGRFWLIERRPGETGAVCTFATTAGDIFSIDRPMISNEDEATLVEMLREILKDEGWV